MTAASATGGGKFILKIEKRTINYVEHVDADYLLIASGSSPQVVMNKWFISIVMYVDYTSWSIVLVLPTGLQSYSSAWSFYCRSCAKFIYFQD